jgi:hypothetical protein
LCFLIFFLISTPKQVAKIANPMAAGSINFTNDFRDLRLLWQGEMPTRGSPQRALFPLKDCSVMFENTPLSGIGPSSLLKERFKLVRKVKLASDLGMVPQRELYYRSMVSMLTSSPSELGICSWNELFDRFR